jgi:hypothetical protein
MNWSNLLRSHRLSYDGEEGITVPAPLPEMPSSQWSGHHPGMEITRESTLNQGSAESTTRSLLDSLRIMPKVESPSLLDILRENAGLLSAVAGWVLILLLLNVGK